ncbi:MAG: cytochrome c [Chloroflexi bacterium]|nr:cytochrome c [Chloroflexota bacterium]
MVSTSAWLHSKDVTNPSPDDLASEARGATVFRFCGGCHGPLGNGRGTLSLGLFPRPSDLTDKRTQGKSDGELFWIVKNGLTFTGMVGYGKTQSDADIWAVVNYMRALQEGRALVFSPPPPAAGGTDNRNVTVIPLTISDDSVTPTTLEASEGLTQLGLTNRGTQLHQLTISLEGKVPYDAGSLYPTQTVRIEAELKSGVYTIAVDSKASPPGPVATIVIK